MIVRKTKYKYFNLCILAKVPTVSPNKSVLDISSDVSDADLLSSVLEIESASQTSSEGLSIQCALFCLIQGSCMLLNIVI